MEKLPQTSVLVAVFFIGSLIHIPIPPAQAHLVLNGLLGLLLGWAAFPAILLALALQALLFQYGGITTLGVNTFNLALPALLCAFLLRPLLKRRVWGITLAGILAGVLGIMGSALLVAGCLILSGESFYTLAAGLFVVHLPIMLVEAVIIALIVRMLARVKPQLLKIT